MKKLSIFAISLMLIFSISCSKDGFDKNATSVTITHNGFDFSGNSVSGTIDGEVITWYPASGSNPSYPNGVWWRNDQGGVNNEQANLGSIDPGSVSTIPSSWDDPIDPLLVGNVYIFKCADGYALVKVNSVNSTDMTADIEYIFSSNGDF